MKKINIITGHYGSGKTNFSANLAMYITKEGGKVTVVDLDIVNPYFRSADFNELFGNNKIELIAPVYANSNLDIPAISFDLEGIVRGDGYIIIDVGGDDAGAVALGRYAESFDELKDDTEMLYVINKYRYLTRTAAEAVKLMYEIETVSKLKHTGIVNNSNLSGDTAAGTLQNSNQFAADISEITGLPVVYTAVPYGIDADVINPFPVDIYVKKIWDLY